jgi:hypothetical protein
MDGQRIIVITINNIRFIQNDIVNTDYIYFYNIKFELRMDNFNTNQYFATIYQYHKNRLNINLWIRDYKWFRYL